MQACVTKFFKPVDPGREAAVFEYLFQKEEADRQAEEARRRQRIKEERARERARRRELQKLQREAEKEAREAARSRKLEIGQRKFEGIVVIPGLYLGSRLAAMNEDWIRSVQHPPESAASADCCVSTIDSSLAGEAGHSHHHGVHFRPLSHVLNVSDTVPNYFALYSESLLASAAAAAEDGGVAAESGSRYDQLIKLLAERDAVDDDDDEEEDLDVDELPEKAEEPQKSAELSQDAEKMVLSSISRNNTTEDADMMDVDEQPAPEKPEGRSRRGQSKAKQQQRNNKPLLPLIYSRISVADSHDENLAAHFEDATRFITGAISSGGSVLVHCREGRSRSVSVVIAYLVLEKKWTLRDAYGTMENLVPDINVNSGFKRQLMQLELEVHQMTSIDFFDRSERAERLNYNETKLFQNSIVKSAAEFGVGAPALQKASTAPVVADNTTAPTATLDSFIANKKPTNDAMEVDDVVVVVATPPAAPESSPAPPVVESTPTTTDLSAAMDTSEATPQEVEMTAAESVPEPSIPKEAEQAPSSQHQEVPAPVVATEQTRPVKPPQSPKKPTGAAKTPAKRKQPALPTGQKSILSFFGANK